MVHIRIVILQGRPCAYAPFDCHADQCEAPPDWRTLRDTSGRGLNVNGSVCLNYTCMCVLLTFVSDKMLTTKCMGRWANVTVGQACVVENTAYIAYGVDNKEFIDVVSRCAL